MVFNFFNFCPHVKYSSYNFELCQIILFLVYMCDLKILTGEAKLIPSPTFIEVIILHYFNTY